MRAFVFQSSEIATEHQSKTHSKKKLQWFDEKPKEDIIQTMLSGINILTYIPGSTPQERSKNFIVQKFLE